MSDGHQNPSKETRKKKSESMMGKNYGKKRSKETCKKISKSMMGKNYGKKQSKETCKKISEAKKIFSRDQILEMRKMLSDGIIYKIIAKKFGVVYSTIGSIKRNEQYADIQLPEN